MARQRRNSIPRQLPGLFDDLHPQRYDEDAKGDFSVDTPPSTPAKARGISATGGGIDALPEMTESDKVFFMSFGSGSSGNCSYIGDREVGFLIDAGVDAKLVERSLSNAGIRMDRVKGICLTHDHGDHIRDVYPLLRHHPHMRLFCTPKTMNGILRRHNISRRVKDYHTPIYKEFPFKIGRFEVTAFDVKHDGADNAGFFITHGTRCFAVATDLGCISDRVDFYLRQADHIMIEANYDHTMLRLGRYPEYLKARIEAENGHLDNEVTGRFLEEIYTPRLRSVFLCHLSHDNNTPTLALETVASALRRAGVKEFGDGTPDLLTSMPRDGLVHLIALPRFDPSPLYTLGI